MTSRWKTSPLASVCTVFGDGDWIESKDQSPEGVRLVQTGNVGEGEFKDRAEKARFISEATFARLRCTEIFAGDCLISRLPDPVGRACLIPETGERMITAVDCTIVRFDQSKLLPEFFAYYSQADDYLAAVEREATGTTRKRISRARLGQIPVPLAPLPEQRRIVAILDEAFEGIATAKANAEKNLHNARELFDGYLELAFLGGEEGWTSTKLGGAFRTLTGSTPSKAKAEFFGAFMPLVKPPELVDDVVDGAADGLSQTGAFVSRVLPVGSVMVSCIGNLGKIGINSVPVACNQQINAILPDENTAVPEFMFFQTLARPFKKRLANAASGTTVPIVNKSKFNEIEIVLPPRQRQQEVVESLRALRAESDRLATLFEQKLTALDELKKSLLHQAFSGAL